MAGTWCIDRAARGGTLHNAPSHKSRRILPVLTKFILGVVLRSFFLRRFPPVPGGRLLGVDARLLSRRSLQFAAGVLVARMALLNNKMLPRSWPVAPCQDGRLLKAAAFLSLAQLSLPSSGGARGHAGALGSEVRVARRAAALLFPGGGPVGELSPFPAVPAAGPCFPTSVEVLQPRKEVRKEATEKSPSPSVQPESPSGARELSVLGVLGVLSSSWSLGGRGMVKGREEG